MPKACETCRYWDRPQGNPWGPTTNVFRTPLGYCRHEDFEKIHAGGTMKLEYVALSGTGSCGEHKEDARD